MNDKLKKVLVVFGGGIVLYWLFKDTTLFGMKTSKGKSNEGKVRTPDIDAKDIKNKDQANGFVALKAYVDAVNNGENAKALEELNREFSKDLKVRVHKRTKDGAIIVSDLKGNVIIEHK